MTTNNIKFIITNNYMLSGKKVLIHLIAGLIKRIYENK